MKRKDQRIDKRSKHLRGQYSPAKLEKALKEIENGLPISTVSKNFNIPRTTLLYKSNGTRPPKTCKPGPEPMLGRESEEEFKKWIKMISKQGFPLTRESLCYSANKLLKEGHGRLVNTYNKDKGPGRRWFDSFMKRHPTLSIRTPEYLHKGRAATNEGRIRKWFEEISDDLKDKMDIFQNPSRVFNCDETAIFLHPKSRPVIASRGQRHVYDASGKCNKENLTILITGNASGDIVPPMAVVSYKKIPSDIAAAANPEWAIGRTPKGWMTCESFFEYIANIFKPYLENKNITKPVILFLDGHSSHISLPLSNFCQQNEIILVALPPNATHIMQPLDVTVFGPLKKDWSKKLEKFKLEKKIEPRKCHVLPIIETVLTETNFKENLKKGFLRCGLCPLNPEAVDYSKCLSNTDECTKNQSTNQNTPTMLLQQFQERIPIFLKNEFEKYNMTDEWTGNQKLCGLFNFYRSIKYDVDFEDLMGDQLYSIDEMPGVSPLQWTVDEEVDGAFPFSCADVNNIGVNEVVDLDVSVTYNELDAVTPSSVNNIDIHNLCKENEFDLHDSNCINGEDAFNLDDSLTYANLAGGSSTSIANDGEMEATCQQVTTYPTTPSSNSSSSSGKNSVYDILNSIVKYKDKDSPEKERKRRKTLKLPSVMTSKRWLDLKSAIEQEKEDEEKRKEEHKAQRKLAQEEREKKMNLKRSGSKTIKSKQKQPKAVKIKTSKLLKSPVKNFVSKIIENPTEIEIGQWVVVEFQIPNSTNTRNYIGKILKIYKGRIYCKFVRSKTHNGYIYKFPLVKDISKVNFSQIKKLLPDPEICGRGLMKFCINGKNL